MKNFIVLDTETAPTETFSDGRVHPETSRVYDLGWIISDGENILAERSFIIAETFFNHALMNSAYYTSKLPQYYEGMGREWKVVSFLEAWRAFKQDVRDYGVSDVWAFNARFDEMACNATIRDYSNGFQSFFIPYGIRVRDIWDYAGGSVCNTTKYVKWCMENEKLTASNNPSTSAETIYQYLTGAIDFVENHTALQDCHCELFILNKARKRKQKTRHSKGQGWRDAAKIKKELTK